MNYAWAMPLSIGDLATLTHERVKTLRYWTDQGLLKAERGANNYRYYSQDTPQRVAFIRSAQALGFTLADIGDILRLREAGVVPCDHIRADLRNNLNRAARVKINAISQLSIGKKCTVLLQMEADLVMRKTRVSAAEALHRYRK